MFDRRFARISAVAEEMGVTASGSIVAA